MQAAACKICSKDIGARKSEAISAPSSISSRRSLREEIRKWSVTFVANLAVHFPEHKATVKFCFEKKKQNFQKFNPTNEERQSGQKPGKLSVSRSFCRGQGNLERTYTCTRSLILMQISLYLPHEILTRKPLLISVFSEKEQSKQKADKTNLANPGAEGSGHPSLECGRETAQLDWLISSSVTRDSLASVRLSGNARISWVCYSYNI